MFPMIHDMFVFGDERQMFEGRRPPYHHPNLYLHRFKPGLWLGYFKALTATLISQMTLYGNLSGFEYFWA